MVNRARSDQQVEAPHGLAPTGTLTAQTGGLDGDLFGRVEDLQARDKFERLGEPTASSCEGPDQKFGERGGRYSHSLSRTGELARLRRSARVPVREIYAK